MSRIKSSFPRCPGLLLAGLITALGVMQMNLSPAAAAKRAPDDLTPILKLAPKGAHLLVAVPNLSNLSEKIGSLQSAWGLPESADLSGGLAKMKQSAGFEQGIHDDGAALIVFPDLTLLGMTGDQGKDHGGGQGGGHGRTKKPVISFLPVSDYGQFLKNFGVEANDEKIVAIELNDGRTNYATKQGDYAVISQVKSMVQTYKPGGEASAKAMIRKAGALGKTTLSQCDVVAYLDMAAMAPTLKPMLESGLKQMHQKMDEAGQMGANQDQLNQQKLWLDLGGHLARSIVDQTNSMILGLKLGDSGTALRLAAQFKPDSAAAKMFPGGEADLGKLLSSLPDNPYMMAGAVDGNAINLDFIVDQVMESLPKESDNPLVQMYRDQLPLAKSIQGYAGAWYSVGPQAAGPMNLLYVYQMDEGSAGKFVKQNKKALKTLNGKQTPMGPGGAATLTTSYTDNALDIEGTSVDQYNLQMTVPPEVRQQMGPLGAMGLFRYNGYIADKNGQVLVTTTPNLQLLTAALKGLDNDSGVGSDGSLDALRKQHLPENLAAEGYISLSGIAQTANNYLQNKRMGPINVPAETPPIASGIGVTDGGLAWRVYLPNEAVKMITRKVQKLKQMRGQQRRRQRGPGAPR